MNTPLRLLTFGVVLVAVFFASLGLGAVVGPTSDDAPIDHVRHEEPGRTP